RPTPLVVSGVMYVNSKTKLFALNAVTGAVLWSVPLFAGPDAIEAAKTWSDGPQSRQRGPTFGDGRIYVTSPAGFVSALDAKTGGAVDLFGTQGGLAVGRDVLDFKFPGQYPRDASPSSLGFMLTHPPAYYNGTLYVGLSNGDNNIR